MAEKKNIITKFLIWKYKYITPHQFLYFVSILIGLLSGTAAVTLKNLTHLTQELLHSELIHKYHDAFYFIFPIIGLLLTLIIIKYVLKKPVSHGIPATLFAISKRKGIMEASKMFSSILTAPLTVGFGGSVGLEGPTVATSAAIGSNISRLFHLNQTSRTLLIGAAAAAAMSSIFKAPLAAIIFAVEIFSLDLTLASLMPLILSSISAILTSYFFLGDDSILHFQLKDKFVLADTIYYGALGTICGLASVYFSKVYLSFDSLFERISGTYTRLLIGGLTLGTLVYFIPPLFGEGFDTINNLLNGDVHKVFDQNIFHIVTENQWWFILFLAGLILFKVVATSITFGAGGVGGVFAPTLFTGSVTGFVFAMFFNTLGFSDHNLSLSNFSLVGMAGLMAGVLHAPLTAIFLIAELTSGHELFIPLMITASISFLITRKYIPFNIYASELAKKGQLLTHNKDDSVLTLMQLDRVIERNFCIMNQDMSLRDLVFDGVAKSPRNIFPIVNDEEKMVGLITLDNVREIMFKQELYDDVIVKNIMVQPLDYIYFEKDDMKTIMQKFQNTSAWNLPVIKDDKYYGFVSKSKLLTAYRRQLINFTKEK